MMTSGLIVVLCCSDMKGMNKSRVVSALQDRSAAVAPVGLAGLVATLRPSLSLGRWSWAP